MLLNHDGQAFISILSQAKTRKVRFVSSLGLLRPPVRPIRAGMCMMIPSAKLLKLQSTCQYFLEKAPSPKYTKQASWKRHIWNRAQCVLFQQLCCLVELTLKLHLCLQNAASTSALHLMLAILRQAACPHPHHSSLMINPPHRHITSNQWPLGH